MRRPFSTSQRWWRETPKRLARSSRVCSSVSRMERTKAPKVREPPRSFSRYFTATLFFSLAIVTSSVVVLVDFLDRDERVPLTGELVNAGAATGVDNTVKGGSEAGGRCSISLPWVGDSHRARSAS